MQKLSKIIYIELLENIIDFIYQKKENKNFILGNKDATKNVALYCKEFLFNLYLKFKTPLYI
ncbi:hypothetical protein BpHYR1_024534 [Brachionus plicatilis]|uniref:Uncharacterized protein n=1 Tax=Brachionus plicatilis TaxID=10195 RepID=A0A3M7PRY2_BRAPC|nr:hypothetical protein BpHYR1_024534 [Brachionus plicatilis]